MKDLLACHYCFDKAFDKFYDMYTATWYVISIFHIVVFCLLDASSVLEQNFAYSSWKWSCLFFFSFLINIMPFFWIGKGKKGWCTYLGGLVVVVVMDAWTVTMRENQCDVQDLFEDDNNLYSYCYEAFQIYMHGYFGLCTEKRDCCLDFVISLWSLNSTEW